MFFTNMRSFFKDPKVISSQDLGTQVICDICNKDYTFDSASGGFLFGSYAYCPDCAVKGLKEIKKHGEEWNIKAYCPPNQSFWNFVFDMRRGNNNITIVTEG